MYDPRKRDGQEPDCGMYALALAVLLVLAGICLAAIGFLIGVYLGPWPVPRQVPPGVIAGLPITEVQHPHIQSGVHQ